MEDFCLNCEHSDDCDLADQVNFCDDCQHRDSCDIRFEVCDDDHYIECNNGFEPRDYYDDYEDDD